MAAAARVPWSERRRSRRRSVPAPPLPPAASYRCDLGCAGQRSLRCGEPGYRHPIGRAGYVIETDRLAKADRRRIAAMLAADPELQSRAGSSSALDGEADQLADPGNIERHERVVLEDPEALI